jgi:hypothetical protein
MLAELGQVLVVSVSLLTSYRGAVSLLVARQVIVRVELVSVLLFVGGLSFKVGSFEVEESRFGLGRLAG